MINDEEFASADEACCSFRSYKRENVLLNLPSFEAALVAADRLLLELNAVLNLLDSFAVMNS